MSDQLVVFATPAFDGNVTLGYLTSLMRTTQLLDRKGIRWELAHIGGDPYLAKVRNAIASGCLDHVPGMTDFFFIDADLEWDAAGVLKLLESPHDVVAGIYPKKNDVPDFPCELEFVDYEMKDGKPVGGRLVEENGWYRARKVPTGFLRIKRDVLARMAMISGRYKDPTNGNAVCSNLFEMGYCADKAETTGFGEWWGEDYHWCEKWYGMGGDIWVWPDIQFGHRGPKTWHGNFNDYVTKADAGGVKLIMRAPEGDTVFPAKEAVAA